MLRTILFSFFIALSASANTVNWNLVQISSPAGYAEFGTAYVFVGDSVYESTVVASIRNGTFDSSSAKDSDTIYSGYGSGSFNSSVKNKGSVSVFIIVIDQYSNYFAYSDVESGVVSSGKVSFSFDDSEIHWTPIPEPSSLCLFSTAIVLSLIKRK